MDDKRKFIGEPVEFVPSALRTSEEAGVDYSTANDITIRYKFNTATGEISDMRRVLHPRDKS